MPSLGIAPRPGGCAGRERMPMQDVAPVSDVFPADGYLHLLEIGVQAIKLSPYRTNRAAHRSIRLDTIAAFLACSCPSWAFRNEVSHSIQERPSESFPTVSGIRQSASRRNFAISRGPCAAAPSTSPRYSTLSRHAVVPSRFRVQVRRVAPRSPPPEPRPPERGDPAPSETAHAFTATGSP